MTDQFNNTAFGLRPFTDAQDAFDHIRKIYDKGASALREGFDDFIADGLKEPTEHPCL